MSGLLPTDIGTYLHVQIFPLTFQAKYMTYLDIWLLLCMLFVGLSIFEYAVCLAIRFGKQNQIGAENRATYYGKAEDTCRALDRYALRVFIGVYAMTVATYFYALDSNL